MRIHGRGAAGSDTRGLSALRYTQRQPSALVQKGLGSPARPDRRTRTPRRYARRRPGRSAAHRNRFGLAALHGRRYGATLGDGMMANKPRLTTRGSFASSSWGLFVPRGAAVAPLSVGVTTRRGGRRGDGPGKERRDQGAHRAIRQSRLTTYCSVSALIAPLLARPVTPASAAPCSDADAQRRDA